jgi:predicted O-methyltransferase YrrM
LNAARASTIWTALRVEHLLSLEHDQEWVEAVATHLRQKGLRNVDIQQWQRPYFYRIEDFDNESLDYVLVDGRDRVECTRRTIPKLKSGAIIVLDNAERIGTKERPGRYLEIQTLLSGWPRVDFEQIGPDQTGWLAPHRWITTIWTKP